MFETSIVPPGHPPDREPSPPGKPEIPPPIEPPPTEPKPPVEPPVRPPEPPSIEPPTKPSVPPVIEPPPSPADPSTAPATTGRSQSVVDTDPPSVRRACVSMSTKLQEKARFEDIALYAIR